MKKMDNLWNDLKKSELANLLALKERFLKSNNDPTLLGNYLLTLANLEKIQLSITERNEILAFFRNQANWSLLILIFENLEYGKQFNYLNMLRICLMKTGLNIKKIGTKLLDIFHALKHSFFKDILNFKKKIHQFLKFVVFFDASRKNILRGEEDSYNTLLKLTELLSKDGLLSFQSFLEYVCNIKIIINQEDTNFLTRTTILEKSSKSTSFLSPINHRIAELNQEKESYHKNYKMMNNMLGKKKNQFIELTPAFLKSLPSPEMEQFALTEVIKYNEQYITKLEKEITSLKMNFSDEYELAFIDSNLDCPNEILLEQIKNSIELEDFKKILKALNKKEFSFLKPEHPNFLEILQNTNELILKEISKEINEKKLFPTYLKTYPQILTKSIFSIYQKNKDLISQNNLQTEFFLNSNLLLLPSQLLQQTINLIKEYHCETLSFYDFNYFDQVDSLIEQRFNLLPNTLEILDTTTTKVQKLLNKQIPLTMTSESENEIAWLDEEFKVDSLRYCINGFIISRIKVLRYFTSLNQCKEDRNQNLIDAIFYNTHFFEFEKQMIMDALKRNQTRKKIISQYQE